MQGLADLQDILSDLAGVDWSSTATGPVETWDVRLRTTVGIVLRQTAPACFLWGASGTMIFNAAWRRALGPLQAQGLGQSLVAHQPSLRSAYDRVLSSGAPEDCRAMADVLLPMTWRLLTDGHGATLSCIAMPGEDGLVQGVLVQCDLEQAHHPERTAERHERNGFRLLLSDALRRLDDPEEIRTVGARWLGEIVNADWASFSDVDLNAGVTRQRCEYKRGEASSRQPATHHLGEPGAALKQLMNGMPLVIPDVRADHGSPPDEVAAEVLRYAVTSFRAQLTVPVLREDCLVAVMTVRFDAPHAWSVDKIALAHEAAVSIWEAIERARAAEALRLNEARHRALFESIDEGVCLFERLPLRSDGLRDYRYINMNPAMQAMFGIPDLSGQSIRDNFPEEVEDWYDDYDRVLETGVPLRLVRESKPQGMVLEMFVTRVEEREDEGGQMLLAVMKDVTIRVRAERALRDSEARKAFLLKLADTVRPMSDTVAIEGECCRLLAEFLDTDRAYYVEIDEPAGVARVARDYVRHGAPSLVGAHDLADFGWSLAILRRGECHVVSDTRTSPLIPDVDREASTALDIIASVGVPLMKSGRLFGALCVTAATPRDWTDLQVGVLQEVAERLWADVERARAESALRESETRLRNVLDGMGEAFGLMDHDFRILTQNRAALELDARPLEEIRGRPFWEVYPGTEDSEIGRLYKHALAEQRPVSLEHCYTFPGGGTNWLDMRAYPVPEGLAVFWRDITKRKEDEEALRQSERWRRVAQKAAGVATFDWEIGNRSVTWSPEALGMLGLRGGAIGGTYEDWIAMIHPDDLPHATEQIEWALEDGELEGEWRIQRPDGSVIFVLVRGVVEHDAQGQPIRLTGAQVDVTDRVRSDEAIRLRMDYLSAQIEDLRKRLGGYDS
ncbi:PAS domain-containing protein [Mameliella sp. AT18]|uniref:PAS domain-containing protein n=1 Tax=Mameliella sp. AT18 TaxID=3028385 RepID=UPI00237AD799|nr:PAS domain-containing protein [Mameliella sp. AT18]MDD9731288.1 PAS domain-containing protein [Mameliella sp. AT18]